MKIKFSFIFLLASITFSMKTKLKEDPSSTQYIVFLNGNIKVSEGGPTVSGTTAVIENPGIYLVSGESEEGNIVVKSNSVKLYLQNLKLTSSKTAPIIVTSDLREVQIMNLQNSILNDLEDVDSTTGECAVVKIKKNSTVSFRNNDVLTLNGICKNVIKGGKETSVIFEKSNGEYIINANKTGISSDGTLEFNFAKYNIISENGDAIKSLPDDEDTDSLGKILIKDGIFNIQSYNDAFTAKNNITIITGTFDIKTENGFESTTYDENESSKGFKITNNDTGCEIKVYSGDFKLNTADDAFHSKRDIVLYTGKYIIYSKDDGLSAKYNLVLGKRNAPLEDLDLQILNSYEALEGMTITIYSGKIIATAEDDGLNASGEKRSRGGRPGMHNRTRRNDTKRNDTQPRNRSRDDRPGGWGGRPRGNSSFYISIYDGEIYVYCDGDGIDSNGNIFFHGGNINVFSQGNRDNEPIDHDGNFTLYNADVLGVGAKGIEYIHKGIKNGNEKYAYYAGSITKNKLLQIKNENNEVVKQGTITKDINYIFYASLKLNENYKFYIYDEQNKEEELNVVFGNPENGEDNEDEKYNLGI